MPIYGVKNEETGEIFNRRASSFDEFKSSLKNDNDGEGGYEIIDGVKCYITWQTSNSVNARGHISSKNPFICRSLSGLPGQERELTEAATKRGVPTEFVRNGEFTVAPKFTSKKHYDNYLSSVGLHNKDNYY